MAGRLALSLLLQSHRGKAFIARFEGADDGVYVRPPGYRSRLRWIIPLLVGLAIVFPFLATKYLLTVAILGLIYVLLGLGLNIVVGLAGLLDLGYVAFYAIGAYGLALGYQYLGLGFWAMLPLGAVMAALAGALLGFPVLRMHGDYLAIVTLGFGEIIRLVLNNWVSFTGGPNGVPVPSPTLFGLEFTRRAKDGGIPIHEFFHVSYNPNLKFIFLYAVLCLVVMLVLLVKHRLTRMPIGRAWEALREDEIACRAMGLNHVLVKLSAFMLGASTAGIAGVFFASYQGFVNPTSFTFFESALILAIVVLGGMGSTLGVVLAAFVLTVTPELLRGFDEYRVLLFGVLMVMMMIWRPRGRGGARPRRLSSVRRGLRAALPGRRGNRLGRGCTTILRGRKDLRLDRGLRLTRKRRLRRYRELLPSGGLLPGLKQYGPFFRRSRSLGHAGNRSLRDLLEGYVALRRCLGAHQQAPEQLLQPRRLGYGLRTLAERTPIGRSRNPTLLALRNCASGLRSSRLHPLLCQQRGEVPPVTGILRPVADRRSGVLGNLCGCQGHLKQ